MKYIYDETEYDTKIADLDAKIKKTLKLLSKNNQKELSDVEEHLKLVNALKQEIDEITIALEVEDFLMFGAGRTREN